MPSSPPKRGDALRAAQRRTRLMYGLVALAIVLGVVLIAVLSSGQREDAVAVEDIAGSPTITGDELPEAPQNPAEDPAIGSPAPVVQGAGFDGTEVVIGEPGQPRLVVFLASWCPACQQELPEVVSLLEEGSLPSEVAITAVSAGHDATRPNWPPNTWFEEAGYDGELLVDDAEGSVARAYGLPAFPYWVALDSDGEVVLRVAGLLGPEQIQALADAVLAEE